MRIRLDTAIQPMWKPYAYMCAGDPITPVADAMVASTDIARGSMRRDLLPRNISSVVAPCRTLRWNEKYQPTHRLAPVSSEKVA